ncbi:MAG TPA: transcription antitermination factor NusB [Anaerolineales bacterium]|nr:transcription antitermination factor NusB [Anaerolineales bacterium]
MKARTRARSVALQVLYEIDMTNHEPGTVFTQRIEEINQDERTQLDPVMVEFAHRIMVNVLPIAEQLDEVMAKYAPEWPIDQISAIDRNIIRIATWEFAIDRTTPVKVAINEAVEIAKMFGSDSTARFVNGVLGSLADNETKIRNMVKVA